MRLDQSLACFQKATNLLYASLYNTPRFKVNNSTCQSNLKIIHSTFQADSEAAVITIQDHTTRQ